MENDDKWFICIASISIESKLILQLILNGVIEIKIFVTTFTNI